ncbi:endolytic transglycosylase MltG [Suttonella sp. R2A3]|uniref:endolytic transglycosylase MltG n=1 Tax=Suttonella sp. R2A3 TaxID=2908648 RepID=UPI001F3D2D9B|nr:endolytic transglycosylase MltG [Suttonella sp. R2A3]UJF24095.1 endolytic transglycosylase MltG [Suttonella sp. R2A3]
MLAKLLRRFVLLVLVLSAVAAGVVYWQYFKAMHRPLGGEYGRTVLHVGSDVLHVPRGSSLKAISAELKRRGVIEMQWPLLVYGKWRGDAGEIKAGDYRMRPGDNIMALYQDMIDGKVIIRSLRVLEGSTYADLRRSLRAADDLEQTLDGVSDEELAERLGIEGSLEGQFLPNTYHYTSEDSDFTMLKRLHKQLTHALDEAWQGRATDLAISTPYEALILASIIEKETALDHERNIISGVFNRRLKKGMRLQTDPTVIYGIPDFDGNITRAHLRTDTPYNTYTRHGLPPTPIALPSKASIVAALHPDSGKSLFFVATGNGGHTFTETYEAHKKAVQQLISRKRAEQ